MNTLIRFLKNEEGATVIEYALIASVVSIAAITSLTQLGGQVSSTFSSIQGHVATSR